jgi:hypothetical protein
MIFAEAPTNSSARWRDGPDQRGSFEILSSCLITLALCIWTAVHLNIPQRNGFWRHVFRKLGWLMSGMFTPEVVSANWCDKDYGFC